ncbi:MAG TPA: polyprenyl synthetase family protein [Rhizomicrobium sp.]|jgi:octaprenyl-diphosphate synthase|nr:polyprenyl synthetase family protein [Rhizomicrobium sp.]
MITAEAARLDVDEPLSPVDRLAGLVADDIAVADRLIHERMGSSVALIPDLARHLVDSGGKRLRPLLTLAAARLCGYQGSAHVKLAAAVEFIHTATLLHDDVVDASSLRRGKLAANIVWGNKPSILVGDFLFSRAFQLMVETGSMVVLDILAGASAIIAEGEVMQLKADSNLATTEADYLRIIAAKTAALFSASAEAGAALAQSSPEIVAALRDYGSNLGIAFQLVDDALDYSGREKQMGKTVGDDFREAKVTLPVILAYQRADEEARRFWHRAIESGPQHDGDLRWAITYVEETGAIRETRARARRYADQASRSLAILPKSELREALEAIAEFCVGRGY